MKKPECCQKCGTPLLNAPGIGLYCSKRSCSVLDDTKLYSQSEDRRAFRANELPLKTIAAIKTVSMDSRHDHLNELLTANTGAVKP
jgi:hypothetical protein